MSAMNAGNINNKKMVIILGLNLNIFFIFNLINDVRLKNFQKTVVLKIVRYFKPSLLITNSSKLPASYLKYKTFPLRKSEMLLSRFQPVSSKSDLSQMLTQSQ